MMCGCAKAASCRFVSYELLPFVIVNVMTLLPCKRSIQGELPEGKMCFCRSNSLYTINLIVNLIGRFINNYMYF